VSWPSPLLEQRTEDLRIDLAPVESARDAQQTELLAIEMHVRGPFEEAAVRERHAGVETVLRARPTRIVQDRVQTAEVVSTRPSALGEQSVHDPGKAVAGDLAEVLGEHRPNALEQEVPQHVRGSGLPLAEAMVDLGDVLHRLARERGLTAGEDGLVAREELERVVLLRQLAQLERTARSLGEPAGLPDLEPAKRTEDDEPWSLDAELGVGGITPVVERLRAVAGQASRLRRCLHLDQADSRPDQIDESAGLRLLEPRDAVTLLAVAGEQLVEEGLSLRALRALVDAPPRRERLEAAPYLLSAQAHAGRRSDRKRLLVGDGEVGPLGEGAVGGVKLRLGLLERRDQVGLSACAVEIGRGSSHTLGGVGHM
jgi:hypothetical protein